MKNSDLIIIGGCASGLTAAINARRIYGNIKITVFDRMPRAGKKILATGNGRCNLSNRNALTHCYRNMDFAGIALQKYNIEKTLGFFASLGLKTYEDSEGRIYPASNTASAVVDAFRFSLDGIEIITDREVKSVKKQNGGFVVDGEYFCKKLIIACGGKSSPSQGSNGSGYALAKSLGHSITPLYPSLVPLVTEKGTVKSLKGVRIHKADISLIVNGKKIAERSGEILFNDSGISGIAAMELAKDVEAHCKGVKSECFTELDFAPDLSISELEEYIISLCKSRNSRNIDSLLTGLLPKAVGIEACKVSELYSSKKPISSLTNKEISKLAFTIKNFRLKVLSSKGFETSQVTSGGINVKEIDPQTMESLICKNLFFAGEIIDVDGLCGGFNLQWAWSSGLVAGELGGKLE